MDIDDDVLAMAKELAKARKSTAGEVISELARQSLTQPESGEQPAYRGGFKLMPRAGTIITSQMVERWLDEDA